MQLDAPGIYPGVSMRDYHAAPAVNARLLRAMVTRCPAAAYFESWLNPHRPPDETNSSMDAGSIAHAILLEGDHSRVVVVDPNDHPAKTTGAIPEGWTNQSIRAARDDAYRAGKIPILKAAFAEVESMVHAARQFLLDVGRSEDRAVCDAFMDGGGESEVSILWKEDDGTLCRIRPDRINTARTLVVDYKTGDVSAEPNGWGRSQMIRMHYYQAAAFYRRGVRRAFGIAPGYVFLVQERAPPYLCSLVGVDEHGFALGTEQNDYGLTLWNQCVKANEWPAYPPRVLYPEIPPWEQAAWEETDSIRYIYEPRGHGARVPLEGDPVSL